MAAHKRILCLCLAIAASLGAQRTGGTVVVGAGAEPKTLNPFVAADQPSRDVIYALSADLLHINRATLMVEPALAKSWSLSRDGKQCTVTLRPGLRFSDGSALTADDVVFTFQAHLDPRTGSTQRELLLMDGKPISVVKISADTLRFDLPAPYGAGERLFDGFWILPRSKLERAYREGMLAQSWGMGAPNEQIAGAGPFRIRQTSAGARLVLERNPYYWKSDSAGRALPYLDRLEFNIAANQETQLLRLRAGELDLLPRIKTEDFASLAAFAGLRVYDAGPGLEYNFLAFNWNATGPARSWFRNLAFRRAVAHAIDRDSLVRLAYQGKASPIWSQVTPGNRAWRNDKVASYPHDPVRAESVLKNAGFRRDSGGVLRDPEHRVVEFTVMVSASNALRRKMATLIEEDLAKVGIIAHATPTEFASMVDSVLHAGRYESVLWGIASGDTDPSAEMNVWPSSGGMHLWNLPLDDRSGPSGRTPPAIEEWEKEVDRLMQVVLTETAPKKRKGAYDRVQDLVSANLPVVFLVSPHILSASRANIRGFVPAILEPVALWNCDQWHWAQ